MSKSPKLYLLVLPISFLLGFTLVLIVSLLVPASKDQHLESGVTPSLEQSIASLSSSNESSSQSNPTEKSSAPVAPRPRAKTEFGLREIFSRPKHTCYKFPKALTAVAYGLQSGTICVAQGDEKLYLFGLEDINRGTLDPKVVPVDGHIQHICSKVLNNKEYFIVALANRPRLLIIDAQDPTSVEEIPIQGPRGTYEVGSSRRTDDPLVYLISSASPEAFNDGWVSCLGTLNLETRELVKIYSGDCFDLLVKNQGEEVWVSLGGSALDETTSSWHTWLQNGVKIGFRGSFERGQKVDLRPHASHDGELHSELDALKTQILACSLERPIFAAMQDGNIATFSFHDFKLIESFTSGPTPPVSKKRDSAMASLWPDESEKVKPAPLPATQNTLTIIDDRRQLLIKTGGERLYVCNIAESLKTQPKASQNNRSQHPWRNLATVGESIEFEFPNLAKDAKFEASIETTSIRFMQNGDKRLESLMPTLWNDQIEIKDGKFAWRPSRRHLGANNVHFELTENGATQQWTRSVTVSSRTALLPFYITGIGQSIEADRVVVWGPNQRLEYPDHSQTFGRSRNRSIYDGLANSDGLMPIEAATNVALLNLKTMQFETQFSVRGIINSAISSGDYVYISKTNPRLKAASSSSLVGMPMVTKIADSGGFAGNSDYLGPVEIVRYDWRTKTDTYICSTKRGATAFEMVANRYLIPIFPGGSILSNEKTESVVIDCQNLEIAKPTDVTTVRGYYSNLGTDYLADGIVYDGQTGAAKMLCVPPRESDQKAFFDRSNRLGLLLSRAGESLYDLTDPGLMSGWIPHSSLTPTCGLLDSDRHVLSTASGLTIHDKEELLHRRNFSRLLLLVALSNSSNMRSRGMDMSSNSNPTPVVIAQKQILTVKFGALFAVDLSEIPPNNEPNAITFDHRQSVFHLPIGKPIKIRYTAKNASVYTLNLSFINPYVGGMPPETYLTSTESRTGEFEIAISKSPALLEELKDVVQSSGYLEMDAVSQQEYLDQFAKMYSILGIDRIEGFPLFVQATVIAENDKGAKRTAIAHCYVIDVPLAFLFEL